MKAKTARVYTVDELKEKCQKALADPKLIEIVKTAPLNKDGKVNLSWVYKEAEKYVHGETKDLQKTKELAVATRFLAMLHRDQKEEFEKLVAQKEQPKIKSVVPKKLFCEIEFLLPNDYKGYSGIELITRGWKTQQHFIRFASLLSNNDASARLLARDFCMEILNALIETADPPSISLMNDLIQLLEEKYGLKIKICATCKHAKREKGFEAYYHCPIAPGHVPIHRHDTGEPWGCEQWTPKEVSEKPSSA